MKTIIRLLPAFAAVFVIGAYMESSSFATATTTAKETTTGLIIGPAVIVCLLFCYMTRSRNRNQQSGRFGNATTSNGR